MNSDVAAREVAHEQAYVDTVYAQLEKAATSAQELAKEGLERGRIGNEGGLVERVRQAVREEMALHLTDAVIGRLDLGTGGPPAEADLATVASVMATELQWSERRTREQRRLLAEVYDWRRADAPRSGP